jgi:photosynthetic reaction center cytochrome c subunit
VVASIRTGRRALALMAAVFLATAAVRAGQAAPAQAAPRPRMAEEVFKNVQVMKGVPVDEFMGSMGYISNALAVNCTYCHLGEGGGGWAEYARDNDKKVRARQMILMMNAINRTYFGGRRVVTCVSCHNGANRPKVTSDMARYYSAPTSDEPDVIARQAPGAPSAAQVIDKFIQAIGGAQRVGALTSLVARGTYLAYGEAEPRPYEVYASAPNRYATTTHTFSGDDTLTFDGTTGWHAIPDAISPITLAALTGAELEGARLDGDLLFAARLQTALTDWRGAIPSALGDKDVQVIQGTMPGSQFPVKLFFDDESGLLLRQIRYTETPLGRNTWMLDYDDYRDVSGVKVAFKRTVRWQSGQAEIELTEVRSNVPVEATRFARPADPAARAN